ncbi:Sec-independent protein translocase protein TatB [Alcaligenes sp. WGS1538]|uniref:Sec-independent protein translocase protein TatB n=1 Tax=Alcaligenes sp. WGS1538 TaxID=3366811 RepID=UPI00372CEA96
MFDVSFTELIVIGVVALIVIGPERLPKVARTAGHLLGRAQRYVNEVKSDIQREINLDEVNKLKDQMEEAARSVRSSVEDTGKSLSQPLEQARDALQQASDSARSALSAQADEPARKADAPPAAPEPAAGHAPQDAARPAPAQSAPGDAPASNPKGPTA